MISIHAIERDTGAVRWRADAATLVATNLPDRTDRAAAGNAPRLRLAVLLRT